MTNRDTLIQGYPTVGVGWSPDKFSIFSFSKSEHNCFNDPLKPLSTPALSSSSKL